MDKTTQITKFKTDMETEKAKLLNLAKEWSRKNEENTNLPEQISGDILSAVGKAKLLVNQRFNQFAQLIGDCEFERGELKTTTQDLQGFWDMITWQIEDVNNNFTQLDSLEKKNWRIEDKENNKMTQKTVKVNRTRKTPLRVPLSSKNSTKPT